VVPFIAKLPSLTHLNLMCNRLTDEGCAHFEHLSALTTLNLSMNPLITDKTLSVLAQLTNLQSLNLNYCKLLSSDGLSILSKSLTSLKQLDIIGCDRALTDGIYISKLSSFIFAYICFVNLHSISFQNFVSISRHL
jgi:F-box/leucine-rich repeat protein 14